MKEILIVLAVFIGAGLTVVLFVPERIQELERARIIQHDRDLEWENQEWKESLEREGQSVENSK